MDFDNVRKLYREIENHTFGYESEQEYLTALALILMDEDIYEISDEVLEKIGDIVMYYENILSREVVDKINEIL